jgi:hypothetical protein
MRRLYLRIIFRFMIVLIRFKNNVRIRESHTAVLFVLMLIKVEDVEYNEWHTLLRNIQHK